jgi:hypothetical protein
MSEGKGDTTGVAVFTDTSVLFNYALDIDHQRADELLCNHGCRVVASKTVQNEFEKVQERRQQLHDDLLPYAKQDAIDKFEPSSSADLTANDRRYIREFTQILSELEPAEAMRRVQERNRRLKRGCRELFKFEGSLVAIVSVPSRDAQLVGYLASLVDNDDDARILCDAVEWTRDGGSGNLVTSDTEDMLGQSESRAENSDPDSDGLPDSFESFLAGRDQSLAERINEKIADRYDEDACLDIYSVDSFLREY